MRSQELTRYDGRCSAFIDAGCKRYPLTFGLCITVFLNYFLSIQFLDTRYHDDQRLLQILFMLLGGAFVLRRLACDAAPIGLTKLTLPLFLFFLLGALSSALAFSPRYALYEVASLLIMCVLALYVSVEIAQNRFESIDLVLKMSGAACALYAFKFCVGYLSALHLGQHPEVGNLIPGFSNIRFLNHTQTITLPMLVLLAVSGVRQNKAKCAWLLLAGFWWSLLFLTVARGTTAGLIAGAFVAWLTLRKSAFSFCRALLLSMLMGLILYAILFVIMPAAAGLNSFGELSHLAQRSLDNPTSGRLQLWQRAVEMIYAHPWTGAGPLHFAHYAIDVGNGAHPHNFLLQIAAEWGLPALLCLFVVVIFMFRSLLQAANCIPESAGQDNTTLAAWIVIGTSIIVDGQVSGNMVMPTSQLLIVLYLGCAGGWLRSVRGSQVAQAKGVRLKSGLFALLVVASLIGILNAVVPRLEIWLADEGQASSLMLPYWRMPFPRLWSDGYF